MTSEFSSQTDLGRLFGVSATAIGKWLKQVGLRQGAEPTKAAIEGGHCKQAEFDEGRFYWVWHTKKTIAALEAAGHRRVEVTVPPTLVGPFDARPNGSIGFEIVDINGQVGIWVVGHSNATNLVKLLNLAVRHRKLFHEDR